MQCACVCLCPTREKQRDIELNQRQRKHKVGDLVRENRVERRYFKSLSLSLSFPFLIDPCHITACNWETFRSGFTVKCNQIKVGEF